MKTHTPIFQHVSASLFKRSARRPRRFVLASGLAAAVRVCVSVVFAAGLSFLLKWGTNGTADGQFSTPRGITVDDAGNVYVAEGNGNRIQKFDANGNFLLKFGVPGDVSGGFVSPSGVAVDSAGNIYTTDSFTNRVQKFNSAGTFQLTWGGTCRQLVVTLNDGSVHVANFKFK